MSKGKDTIILGAFVLNKLFFIFYPMLFQIRLSSKSIVIKRCGNMETTTLVKGRSFIFGKSD